MGTMLPLAHQRRSAGPQAYQYRGIFHIEDSHRYFSYPLIIPSGTQRVSPGGDRLLAITNPIYCTATASWIA